VLLLLAAARERLSPGQDVLDLGDLPVVPARMDEVADWTGEPELPVQPAAVQGLPDRLPARRHRRGVHRSADRHEPSVIKASTSTNLRPDAGYVLAGTITVRPHY
jgi:hypothetical protein